MLQWRETKVTKIKIANLPDNLNLKVLNLLLAKINEYRIYNLPMWLLNYSGTFDILVGDKLVHTYNNEGSFGELALLYNTPRNATIKAKSAGVLWALVSNKPYMAVSAMNLPFHWFTGVRNGIQY